MSGLFESLGAGTSGGFLGTLIGYFVGSKQQSEMREDMKELKKSVVYKDTCNVCSSGTQQKLDYIIMRIDKHFDIKADEVRLAIKREDLK